MKNENPPSPTDARTRKARRDDFKAAVKVQLAQCVGYLCSHPNCQRPTIGPKMGDLGSVNVGIAAHIKAAAAGGPRYDANQTPADRSAFDNGIWLCSDHAHIIDHDEKQFTNEILRGWKRDAEERAFQQLVSGRGPAAVYPPANELVDELRELRSLLGLPAKAALPAIREKLKAGALVQIEAFEASPRWPQHPVNLELAIEGSANTTSLDLSRIPQVLMAVQRIVVVSGPGTGKTTTLLQAARTMIASGPVPVFVPLGEWAEAHSDLFTWLVGRHGYEGLNSNHVKLLAHHGEVALFLDGWNEVPASARRRLIKELEGLQRDYPLLHLVVSSRRETLDVPIVGRKLDVLPLSESQQSDIANAMRGESGRSILDTAWRTPGLRELIVIPLYLRALIEASSSGTLPETKEEILRRMVDEHESDPANAEIFHRDLQGFHHAYLAALATRAQETGRTALPLVESRAALGRVNKAIVEEGLSATPPNATAILDSLVAGHSLILAGETYGYQHQQFLEWFASKEVEDALRSAGQLAMDHPFVTSRLNETGWGEAVLFAFERMSRADTQGCSRIAEVVELLLGIDPQFAAMVIKRSGAVVWEAAKQTVITFARSWHSPGQPDRAARFMITSGRPEFADLIWPLVSGTDHQVQAETIRLVERFNPAVLGSHLTVGYGTLSDEARDTLVGELAYHGDSAGMDAALNLALTEPSLSIRYRVFEALDFRGASSRVERLIKGSSDALAQQVAQRGDWDSVRDVSLIEDLVNRQSVLIAADPSPVRRLARATASSRGTELGEAITSALHDPTFSYQNEGEHVVAEASARLPETVAKALEWRLINGYELPHRPYGYFDALAPDDGGPISRMLLDGDFIKERARYAAYLVGTDTVGDLLKRFLEERRDFHAVGLRTEAAYAPVRALEEILESTRADVLFAALQKHASVIKPVEIRNLCDIIIGHGRHHGRETIVVTPEQRALAVSLMDGWARQLFDQQASRAELGRLTRAMRRLPDPSQAGVLGRMLNAELRGLQSARVAFEEDRRNEAARSEIGYSHAHDYRTALTAVGTREAELILKEHLLDPDFGIEAAVGLQVIWLSNNEARSDTKFQQWPDFERAIANRSRDRSISCDAADAILKAAEAAKAEGTVGGQRRAMQLAGRAALLPHGERSAFYADLMQSSSDSWGKLDLAKLMVVGGLVPASQTIMSGLQEWIASLADRTWVDDSKVTEMLDWLKLLPYSDDPKAFFVGLDAITPKFDFGWWRLRDVCLSIKYLPEVERINLLRGIAQRVPDLIEQYEFYLAMPKPGAITLDFLEQIISGQFAGKSLDRGARFDYPQQVFGALSPEDREKLPERFERAQNVKVKHFLAEMLLAGADHEVFLMLASDPAGRTAITNLRWGARESLLYHHESIGGNAFELIPRDIKRLREGLFDLTQSADRETAAFAVDYLERIDSERDGKGDASFGPRHPRLASGRPWPDVERILAAASSVHPLEN
ncbi:hypothetical protein [Ensifer sp.]|uniref:NACHT domain-containing protein n=1 Tax=Ensifer sp. TaxID=1872086 RepID=UPI002896E3E2|nr:hypothetical protein [Ensifer sp.]